MTYIKKSYQEIVDDASIKIRGGIVKEFHTFVPDENRYILDQAPVAAIAVVKGTVAGEAYTFSPDRDFHLAGENSIQWTDERTPDAGTRFYISYFPRSADSAITDVNIGSVSRTLIEAFAWEAAVIYKQLQIVYENGFIDTAGGKSLDFLVKLLDITRIEAGFALGEAAFSRNTPAPADITIPGGTLVSGLSADEKGNEVKHLYKTTEDGTLRRGELSVNIPVRAETRGPAAPAGGINTMPKPILGIEAVSNPDDTVLGSREESDQQLRERAKARIKGTSTVTRDAILTAMLEKDFVTSADVVDRPDNSNGEFAVVLDTDRVEVEKEVRDRLHAIKAAGVHFDLVFTTKVYPKYKITLTPPTELSEKQEKEIQKELEEKVGAYLRGLSPSATVIASKILAIAMGIPNIEAAEITSVSIEQQDGDVRILPNCDLMIGKFHKATAGNDIKPVEVTFKPHTPIRETPSAGEVPTQQLQVEAYIYIRIIDPSLNELRTKRAIETSVRAYLSNLFYEDGDTVDFGDFLDTIKTDKFNEIKERVEARITKNRITKKWGKYVVKIAASPSSASLRGDPVWFEQDTAKYTFLRLVHSGDGLEKILLNDSGSEEIRAGEVIEDPKIYIYTEPVK